MIYTEEDLEQAYAIGYNEALELYNNGESLENASQAVNNLVSWSSTLLNRLFTLANQNKVFYIDSDKNILSIGDYPQKFYELKSNGYKIKQCNLIFDYSPIQNDGYRCKVDSIYFKLNSSNKYFHYIINQEISFSPGANLIYVPIDIMDTLANDFLPKSIYEQCEYIQEQQRFVRCNTDFDPSQLKELKPISFVFNSFSISIPPSDLFDTIDGNK